MSTPRNEEFDRIRGYLQAQAAKLTIPELADKVRTDMEQLHAVVDAIPAGAMERRPADGEWCANEILAHLTATSRDVARAITLVLDGGEQPRRIPDRVLPTGDVRAPAAWWDALLADREALIARVRRASGDEYLDITWNHPMFGDLNWREWFLFTRLHDIDHARQLQSLLAAIEDA